MQFAMQALPCAPQSCAHCINAQFRLSTLLAQVTMDGSVARIVQFSDSDDDEPKLKPRPAPELPPKQPRQELRQRQEHRNLLGERLLGRGHSLVRNSSDTDASSCLSWLWMKASGWRRESAGWASGRAACGTRPCSSAPASVASAACRLRGTSRQCRSCGRPTAASRSVLLSRSVPCWLRPVAARTPLIRYAEELVNSQQAGQTSVHCSWRCSGFCGGVSPRHCHSWSSPAWQSH